MPTTIKIGPLTRIEGHLDIEVSLDSTNRVVSARSSATMFRGFEAILRGRDPRDAPHFTQRICGVCPVSHGMASSLVLEAAFGVRPSDNGRVLRNLVLGSNFIQSHVLHFYHLAALDYIDTRGIAAIDKAPWRPRYVTPDMLGGSTAATLVGHYVQALDIRRKAHQMGAIFGGKLPCTPTFILGGCSSEVTSAKISAFAALLTEITSFVQGVYLPDVDALAGAFPAYKSIGQGCGNLLAYGVFDLDAAGSTKLLGRGRFTDGQLTSVDATQISEYVKYSYYAAADGSRNPANGTTTPSVDKAGAYSWIKAPRYLGKVHEVGPLARMWVNGDYREGISVIDRLKARALETLKVAQAMAEWLGQLRPSSPVKQVKPSVSSGTGIGLTEAPRGALGHWLRVASSRIDRYQIITPTGWNASPMDDANQNGAIEQALVGTPVADPRVPIELLRVVHSFDPCLACSVHLLRPSGEARRFAVTV